MHYVNQAAGFSRCLVKVQQQMQSQLKAIRVEQKGKSASKVSAATSVKNRSKKSESINR